MKKEKFAGKFLFGFVFCTIAVFVDFILSFGDPIPDYAMKIAYEQSQAEFVKLIKKIEEELKLKKEKEEKNYLL